MQRGSWTCRIACTRNSTAATSPLSSPPTSLGSMTTSILTKVLKDSLSHLFLGSLLTATSFSCWTPADVYDAEDTKPTLLHASLRMLCTVQGMSSPISSTSATMHSEMGRPSTSGAAASPCKPLPFFSACPTNTRLHNSDTIKSICTITGHNDERHHPLDAGANSYTTWTWHAS